MSGAIFTALLTLLVLPVHGEHAPPRLTAEEGPPSWGHLEATEFLVEPPHGYAPAENCAVTQPAWLFPAYTPQRLAALLDQARLDPSTRAAFDERTRCYVDGCRVIPTFALIERLSPPARGVIYAALAAFEENTMQRRPFRLPAHVEPWSARAGLSETARALLEALTYPRGDERAFSDLPLLCARLTSEAERIRLIEVLTSRVAVRARLRVSPGADVAALARYWHQPLSAAPGGDALIDVVELLPPFARARVYTYPPLAGAESIHNCFWTALHFFDDGPPDPTLIDTPDMVRLLARDYVDVTSAPRLLGDVASLWAPHGALVHTASFVADDLVFTKNGNAPLRPWTIEHLAQTRAVYPEATELRWFRRRAVTKGEVR
jgi:hypothetical protein